MTTDPIEHPTGSPAGTAEVFKSSAMPTALNPLADVSAGQYGELPWPVPPLALLQLYVSSPEHQRCVHVKAEGAFGGGVNETAAKLDDLCEAGAADLFTGLDLDQEIYGNAFLQLIRSGGTQGQVVALRRLPAVHMHRRRGGGYVQVLRGPLGTEAVTHFRREDVIHVRPACPFGGFYSLPSWSAASGFIELIKSAVEYNKTFFENGAMPEYVFIVKGGSLTDGQKNAAREFFQNNFRGIANSHKTLFLQFDDKQVEIDLKRATAEVKDGDFVKLLDTARDRIPIAHGVPPRMIGIVSTGALGGSGEVTGQLHIFEHLTLAPKRRRMMGQLRPLLDHLGIDRRQAAFEPLDLTPPQDDRKHLSDWVRDGILSPEQARETALEKSGDLDGITLLLKALEAL